ncbi:hypothetical protein AHiyo1_36630 [Arthrobacter sp. Hiyo1]|nr:hypothetical protein AHiyo1_36630 [Arthrobacter sp. Hiyo1]
MPAERGTDVTAAAQGALVTNTRLSSSLSLMASELSVLFRRLRTWAMLLALAAIPILIAAAVKLSSHPVAPGAVRPSLIASPRTGFSSASRQ